MKRWVPISLCLVVSATADGQGDIGITSAPAWDDDFNPQVEEYEVEEGDTLWDISARVVGDPFKWPKVWSLNPEITNPHWIYPGDRVRFYQPELDLPSEGDLIAGEMAMPDGYDEDIDEIVSIHESSEPETKAPAIEMVNAPKPRPRGRRLSLRFLRRFITVNELQESGVLTNAVPDKMLLSNGDRVYLEFPPSKRPKRGERLLTYRTRGEIVHPISGAHRGYLTQITAVLRVDSFKEEAVTRATIVRTVEDVERGQYVTPLDQDLRVRLVKVPTDKKIEAMIMAVRDEVTTIAAAHQLVYIDKGKSQGLERGNQLRVMARSDDFTGDVNDDFERPIGLLQVVDVRSSASTCLIINSRRDIMPGARAVTIVSKGPPKKAKEPAERKGEEKAPGSEEKS